MRKIRNCAQLIFVARKMRKFVPTRKPVALETLGTTHCHPTYVETVISVDSVMSVVSFMSAIV